MTVVDTYSAECGDCGHIELLNFILIRVNSFTQILDMGLSDDYREYALGNMKGISSG